MHCCLLQFAVDPPEGVVDFSGHGGMGWVGGWPGWGGGGVCVFG